MPETKKERKVIFRRIRGRIVPIRVKKDAKKRDFLGGAALVGAGAGIGFAGGRGSRKILRKATEQLTRGRRAFQQTQVARFKMIDPDVAAAFSTVGVKAVGKTTKFTHFARATRIGATLAGAGLIATGVQKLFEDKTIEKQFVSNVAGQAAATAFVFGAGGKLALLRKIKRLK